MRAAGTGRVQHQGRAVAHVGHGHDAGARLQPVLGRVGRRGQQHRGGAVDHARRVAGVVHVLDLQVRIDLVDQPAQGRARCRRAARSAMAANEAFRRGQAFQGGLAAGELLAVQGQRAVLVIDRHQGAVEAALADRLVGALLADQGQLVQGLPRDALQRGDGVGADALVALRMPGPQAQVAAVQQAGRGCGRPWRR